jgi:hypothetical protein
MSTARLAVLLVAGFGLSACVGVRDVSYGQPYGTFTGSTHLATTHAYRSGERPYLYNQSQRSWTRTYDRQNQGNYRNRHNRPGHDNRRNF